MGLGTYDVDVNNDFDTTITEYTLTVYILPHPRPFSRSPKYDDFVKEDLAVMKTKTVKILSRDFQAEMRCEHVRKAPMCDKGCYVLEKGGDHLRRLCGRRPDCDGHAYCGRVAKDNDGFACFGKKGKRMVCIDEGNKKWITDE
jgi:hypothetical protein